MPINEFEYDGEDARQVDKAKVSLFLTSYGVLYTTLSSMWTGVYMSGTIHVPGRVHRKGAVNSEKLQYVKATWAGLAIVIPIMIVISSIIRGRASSSKTNVLAHLTNALVHVLLALLTFASYAQEGYGGLVGELPKAGAVPWVWDDQHKTPLFYLTDPRTRTEMVRMWVGSGCFDLLAAVFIAASTARLWVARRRNERAECELLMGDA